MEEIKITMDRYEELIIAEHTIEVIKQYIADEEFISTKYLKILLEMKGAK